MTNLDDLRAAAEKATPGPWENRNADSGSGGIFSGSRSEPACVASGYRGNSTFIAAADPPTVIALLDLIDGVEELLTDGRPDLCDEPDKCNVCKAIALIAKLKGDSDDEACDE